MLHSFAIIIFAALIHASFQLSVSMLTLLSSHAIGKKTRHTKLLRLTNGFFFGVAVMTMLALSFAALVFQNSFGVKTPLIVWAIGCGLLLGLGVAVWAFYYRREEGTTLWIPRSFARYLSDRTKATSHAAEAFGLGLSSVLAELVFIVAPLVITALVLIRLPAVWQLGGILTYTAVSLLPLAIVTGLIGSGHKISSIQRWREDNKRFMQFVAGGGLLVLGLYVYVDQVVSVTAFAYGGQ
ncbi:MAG TPA: hypothetical protein VIQ80_02560 [Candidatus Saccharimonadales bacterium]